jgi:hypothetical protein
MVRRGSTVRVRQRASERRRSALALMAFVRVISPSAHERSPVPCASSLGGDSAAWLGSDGT